MSETVDEGVPDGPAPDDGVKYTLERFASDGKDIVPFEIGSIKDMRTPDQRSADKAHQDIRDEHRKFQQDEQLTSDDPQVEKDLS